MLIHWLGISYSTRDLEILIVRLPCVVVEMSIRWMVVVLESVARSWRPLNARHMIVIDGTIKMYCSMIVMAVVCMVFVLSIGDISV